MGIFSKIKEIVPAKELISEAGESYQAKLQKEQAESARDAAWETAHIEQSGWKDEYVLVLLSVPLVLAFVPYTAKWVLEGFKVLEMTPEWYRWLVGAVFTAVYGIRVWRIGAR